MYQHRVYLNMQFSLTGKKLDWIWTSLTGRHGPAACLRGLYMIVLGSVLLPLPLFQRANTVEINSEVLFLIQLWLERQAFNSSVFSFAKGLPWWLSGKEFACQCRRHKRHVFDPWVWKIPWSRKWQLTPMFLIGEFHRQRSLADYSPWSRKEQTYWADKEMIEVYCRTHLGTWNSLIPYVLLLRFVLWDLTHIYCMLISATEISFFWVL